MSIAKLFAHVQRKYLVDPIQFQLECSMADPNDQPTGGQNVPQPLVTEDDKYATLTGEVIPLTRRHPTLALASQSVTVTPIRPYLPPAVVESDDIVVERAKPMVGAPIHRAAPEGFDLGPAALEKSDAELKTPVTNMMQHTYLPPALLDWLSTINVLEVDQVSDEIRSVAGRSMMKALKASLWFRFAEHEVGVVKEAADELESLGYQVSFNKASSIMLVELKHATLRWTVKLD